MRTADLLDLYPDLPVAEPILRDFGGKRAFFGPIRTLRVLEDNALVRRLLETEGRGQVLVVDGGGSLRTALLGGNLARLAHENGWAGVVVYGAVRDTLELAQYPIGIRALAPCPRRSRKEGQGEVDVPVRFAGVTFHPGHWLYADEDGLVLSPTPL
ncbi:ribonuclease E activity regulator RraA [Thermus filiformis]|uniref:4-hydroxy-4-methyl-2-oxoglutarate aldolase n=1 Tax=Thermus filiformis TaxID=276 RepID=A0A0A2WR78_THEFI|nr:ribonuclease E activity regulator RraA [Thermus filiformis]KGQ22323.1 hypothetical protein THFILI_10180 [Thermus filiformis]